MRDAAHSESFLPYLRDRNDTLLAVLYDTGLRVGELVQLDVAMFELDDRELIVPGRIQKDYPTNRSPRTARIGLGEDTATSDTVRRVKTYLETRWRESPALFPSRQADRMTAESVRRAVRSLAEEAGVRPRLAEGGRGDPSDVTPHALRHSVAYRMLHEEDGYTLYDVRNRLRHATILTTERVYDHFEKV